MSILKKVFYFENGLVILKNYLVEGYVVNEKRLSYLEKQINLISIASRLDERLISDEGNNNWFNNEFSNYVIILG